MESVAALRSLKPATLTLLSPKADRQPDQAIGDAALPVGETERVEAVFQPAGLALVHATHLGERDEGKHPASEARAAADAARKAYIQASLAAGVCPLPLP